MHQRACRASSAQQIRHQIQHLRVQDGRSLEVLACRRSAGENEDARANDGADAQRRKRPRSQRLLKTMPGSSASAISLSMDLQQRSWWSDVRTVGDWAKGFCLLKSAIWRLAISPGNCR